MLDIRLGQAGIRLAAITGMDPSADWLLRPDTLDFLRDGEDTLIPAIFLIDEPGDLDIPSELLWRIPLNLPARRYELDAEAAFLGFAPRQFFEELAGDRMPAFRDAAKAIVLGSPIDSAALPWRRGQPLPEPPDVPDMAADPWPPCTVVIGIIDDGIAFANRRFRLPDGASRVHSFWMQGVGPASPSVSYGRELFKDEIDDLLQDWRIGGSVDEPALYRAAGLVDFATADHKAAAWRAAHGTHVLDLAAALEPCADPRSRPIVAVELPTHAVADTSFKRLECYVLHAIDHILDRAARLAGTGPSLPVVICFSYGMFAGSHDGTHPVERLIDQYVGDKPEQLAVVLPAGNNQLGRNHAELRFTQPNVVETLHWRVQPDDRNSSSVQIWLPHRHPPIFADRVQFAVEPPSGQQPVGAPLVWLGEQSIADLTIRDAAGREVGRGAYRFLPAPTERGVFMVDLDPTMRLAPLNPNAGVAPAGLWRLHLRNLHLGPDEPVRLWTQRNDAPYGYPIRGRQSYFDDPRHLRFGHNGRPIEDDSDPDQVAEGVSPVKRTALVNAIATGTRAIVAGGFERAGRRVARISAGGPVTGQAANPPPPGTRKPDALLPSDDSRVRRGVLAAGTATGSIVAFTGTSMAAPQLARFLARRLAQGEPVDRAAVKLAAQDGNPPPPEERQGWGMLDMDPIVKLQR